MNNYLKTIGLSVLAIFIQCIAIAYANNAMPALILNNVQHIVSQHLIQAHKKSENITADEVSALMPYETQPQDFAAGIQQKKDSNPASTSMMVQYGSITKEYTSTLILKLIQNHKKINDHILTLQTRLKTIFPKQFQMHTWPPAWAMVSIKELLDMTSGITKDGTNLPPILRTMNFEYPYTLENLVNLPAQYQITQGCKKMNGCFVPGSAYFYSNTNYLIAGLIVQKGYHNSFAHVILKYMDIQNSLF